MAQFQGFRLKMGKDESHFGGKRFALLAKINRSLFKFDRRTRIQ